MYTYNILRIDSIGVIPRFIIRISKIWNVKFGFICTLDLFYKMNVDPMLESG